MSDEFYKAQILECPSCGANLSLPDGDFFSAITVASTIIVPTEMRHRQQKPTSLPTSEDVAELGQQEWQKAITQSEAEVPNKQKRSVLILAISLGVFILITGIVGFLLVNIPSEDLSLESEVSNTRMPTTPLPTLVQFARAELVFGSQGDQPGQFSDARSIAVDDQGNIFVADYTTGRINKFDPSGNFLN